MHGNWVFQFFSQKRSPWERLKMASEKHTKATRTKRQVDDTYKKRSASAAKLFLCFEFAELQPNSGGAMLAARSKGHQPWMLETPRKSFCLCISLPAGSPVNTSFQMQSAKRLPFPAHVWYEISSSLFRRVLHVPITEEPAAPAAANSEKIFPKWHHWICVFQRWRGKLDFSAKLWLSPI